MHIMNRSTSADARRCWRRPALPRRRLRAQAAPVKHTVERRRSSARALGEARRRSPKGAILLLHGRTWSSLPDFDLQVPGEHHSLMDALVARGYAVYALDLRGYGATPRDASGWDTPDRSAEDLSAALAWVAKNSRSWPASPRCWAGRTGRPWACSARSAIRDQISALILTGYWKHPDSMIVAVSRHGEARARKDHGASGRERFHRARARFRRRPSTRTWPRR